MTQEIPEIPGFRYVRPLGKNVHLYREFGRDREVAVKALEDAQRGAEIKAVVALGHPCIVTVHRAGRTRLGLVYLVMKYYPNGDLATAAPLPVDRVLEIGVRVAEALQAAHEAGVVHRDVKPANILLDEHGDPVLTDFGVHGRVSLPWTAPEVVRNRDHGVAADVFSLGATLWHVLTGHSPFVVPHGNNSRSMIEARILHGDPAPTGRAPRSLEELLRRAMATNPAARPASAKEFAARLRAIQREQGTAETPLDAAEVVPAGHVTRKPPRWPVYAAVVAVVTGAVVTSVTLLPHKDSLPPVTQTEQPVQPQNAGGESALPGRPTVTATRVDANTHRFTWTYDAPLATDTFVWRTNDELKTGTVNVPSVELFGTVALCIEVKVVRADGSNAGADQWSPEGCGF